jgi:hypothetical protein
MPTQTLKNKRSNARIVKFAGSPVPVVYAKDLKRGITFKLPANLLQPKEILRAKLKNRANATKKRMNEQARLAEERRQRLESQARFAAMLRNARERNRPVSSAPFLLSAFANNNNTGATRTIRRGPGARGMRSPGAGNGSGSLTALPAPVPLLAPRMTPNMLAMLSSANSTVRKANLLRMAHMASKASGAPAPAPAPPRKPLGKFWKKEGTNSSNSNSD